MITKSIPCEWNVTVGVTFVTVIIVIEAMCVYFEEQLKWNKSRIDSELSLIRPSITWNGVHLNKNIDILYDNFTKNNIVILEMIGFK